MTEAGAQTFRTLDKSGRLADGYVNPYYPPDLKRRVAGARIQARSVRRRGATHGRGVPALGWADQRHDADVSARWSRFDVTNGTVLRWALPTPSPHAWIMSRTWSTGRYLTRTKYQPSSSRTWPN
jgi:hypothetical protein